MEKIETKKVKTQKKLLNISKSSNKNGKKNNRRVRVKFIIKSSKAFLTMP